MIEQSRNRIVEIVGLRLSFLVERHPQDERDSPRDFEVGHCGRLGRRGPSRRFGRKPLLDRLHDRDQGALGGGRCR
jgi:hypothetical protein